MEKFVFRLGRLEAKQSSQFEMAPFHKRKSRDEFPALSKHFSIVKSA